MRFHFLHRNSSRGAGMLALALLVGCTQNEAPDDALQSIQAPKVARIVPAKEALAGARISTVDPATMREVEIRKALPPGPRCDYRYTTRGNPVLAFTLQRNGAADTGVVKLNGHLVVLKAASSTGAGDGNGEFMLRNDPIQMTVIPDSEARVVERRNVRRNEANAIFEVGQSLRVGYRGYLDCTSEPPTISPRETSGR